MRLLELLRLPFINVKRRYCRHDWAPSRSQTGGWVCVRCGEREATGERRASDAAEMVRPWRARQDSKP